MHRTCNGKESNNIKKASRRHRKTHAYVNQHLNKEGLEYKLINNQTTSNLTCINHISFKLRTYQTSIKTLLNNIEFNTNKVLYRNGVDMISNSIEFNMH